MKTVTALRDDIVSAIRLAVICLNPVACVCQVFMMLKPAWIDNLPNELQECSVPDIMIDDSRQGWPSDMIGLLEAGVNTLFIDPINAILKPIKKVEIGASFKIPVINKRIGFSLKPFDFIKLIKRLCIPYKDIKDCKSEADLAELAALLGCSFDDKNLWKRCYYERVPPRARCTTPLATTPSPPPPPRFACSGQVDLFGGRRHGQWLQGSL